MLCLWTFFCWTDTNRKELEVECLMVYNKTEEKSMIEKVGESNVYVQGWRPYTI